MQCTWVQDMPSCIKCYHVGADQAEKRFRAHVSASLKPPINGHFLIQTAAVDLNMSKQENRCLEAHAELTRHPLKNTEYIKQEKIVWGKGEG